MLKEIEDLRLTEMQEMITDSKGEWEDEVDNVEDSSLLRRGLPVSHSIFGIGSDD